MDLRRRKDDSPMNRLRSGKCPICGIAVANATPDGKVFIPSNGLPKCCCSNCYSVHDEEGLRDSSWDVRICEQCPLRGLGPD